MTQIKDNIETLNKITEKIIGLAIELHNRLGPGFTEKIYQEALCLEFDENNIKYDREKTVIVKYKGKDLGEQRLDFLIEESVILEIKATENIGAIHVAQVLSYLKATDRRLGLILNFAEKKLAIKRIIN